MKRIIVFLVLLIATTAFAGPPGAPPVGPGTELLVKTIKPLQFTVATLPSLAAGDVGTLAAVSDGDGATDCVTGGGTDRVMCRWTGSAWENAGDGQAAGSAEVQDEVFSSANFNADTSHGVSQDDFYDLWHGVDSDDDGSFADEAWLTAYLSEAELTSTLGAAYDTEAELDDLFAAKQNASTAATDSELAELQADDLVTLSGVAIGSTHLGTFTGTTITDNQTIKAAVQELETAVEAAGAADAFTVKVDAGATAGYIGATYDAGAIRTDGTAITKTDGGDYVTIGAQAYLLDIAGLTLAEGDILYFDGTDVTNLGHGVAGQFLETQGASNPPRWGDPSGSGDITKVGDGESGNVFTGVDADGNTANSLWFEGTTVNNYEVRLTAANPGADVIVTIPATTGTLLLADGDGSSLTSVDAATGDSATAFFDAGAIETNYGGTGADLSAVTGIMGINAGTYVNVDTAAELETYAGLGAFANEYLDDPDAATMLATLGIDSAANLESSLSLGAYASDILGAADSDALVTLLGLVAGDIPDLSDTYEAKDAEILRADTADNISADMEFQDNIPVSFGNDNDFELSYDTDLSNDDAGDNDFAAGTFTTAGLKLNANSASNIPVLFNNSGTGGIDLYVNRIFYADSLNYSGSENVIVGLDANAGGVSPTASAYELYFDAGVFKWNENGAEKTAAKLEDAQTFTGAKTFNSLYLENGATSAGFARFYEDTDDGAHYVTVQAQAMDASYTLTLPVDDGTNGEALLTNGSGVLSWGSPSASAGGSDTQVQFNSGGSTLAGDAGFIFTAATDTLTLGEDGQDGSLVLYNELGGTDYNHTISVNANQTGAITSTLPSTTGTLMNNALTNTYLFVGSAGGVATGVQMSGDATLANTGALTIANNAVENAMMADNAIDSAEIASGAIDLAHMSAESVDSDQYVDGSIDTAHLGDDQVTFAKLDDDGNYGPLTGAWNWTGGSVELDNGTNPSTSATANIAIDNDDNFLEIYGSASRSIPTEFSIPISVYKPNDWDDAQRDFMPIFTNNTGASITITKIYAMASADDTDFRIEEYDADGSSNEALVKAETCDTGTGPYTNDGQTTITNATVENGHVLVLDFDDTDTPAYVHMTIWYTVGGVD